MPGILSRTTGLPSGWRGTASPSASRYCQVSSSDFRIRSGPHCVALNPRSAYRTPRVHLSRTIARPPVSALIFRDVWSFRGQDCYPTPHPGFALDPRSLPGYPTRPHGAEVRPPEEDAMVGKGRELLL